ncbi:hypothetical protein [Geothermobacter hydrogeniphilus]|uniref:Uncharacterized protein n=1 Tax=Geothermobacter hydrogeniphilus TaxID=1969733 RepID=A0A1X0Y8A2_9BACT|nr:hypothetical protein [Geothermobacter hydrogeniphilus]ORJ61342.1 hypothetical protein B5V00_06835 [Geothermobacter hydrogeniphilus]
MLQMIFTVTERGGALIVGAEMAYAGRTHVKRVVFPSGSSLSGADREKKIEAGLMEILDQLKRPCRIDLKTDLYRLVESRWIALGKSRASQHQITWSLVPPTSRTILKVQAELRRDASLVDAAEGIFFGQDKRKAQVA